MFFLRVIVQKKDKNNITKHKFNLNSLIFSALFEKLWEKGEEVINHQIYLTIIKDSCKKY